MKTREGTSKGRAALVSNEIRRKISEKVYKAGEPLPPERALADELGVSRITIRNSLETLTAEGLVERRPGVGNFVIDSARQRGKSRTASVGVVVQQINNPYYSNFAMYLERRLAEHDLSMVLASTGQDPDEELRALERMKRENVRGMILGIPSDEIRNSHLNRLNGSGIATVVLGIPEDGRQSQWDSISSNDRAGLVAAVDHLLELGHRNIGYICAMGHDRLDTRLPLAKGILEEKGLASSGCIEVGVAGFDGGRLGLDRMLADHPKVSAIITTNDITALGVLQRATEIDISIPDDISLIGFDDIPQAAMASVPLTTLATPTDEIADLALDRLLARIKGRGGRPVKVILEPELVVRGTTAKCRILEKSK